MVHMLTADGPRRNGLKIHGKVPHLERCIAELRPRHKYTEIELCEADSPNAKLDPTRVRLFDLKRISLKELYLQEVAKGKCLLLRTLELAKKVNGITTVVEDHVGNVVLLCVYNFTNDLNPDLSDIFPVGTVLFLKEPYINVSEGRDCFLRCDCPSDIIVVYEGHVLFEQVTWKHVIDPEDDFINRSSVPNTSHDYVDRGDILVKYGKFQQAVRCYLLALQKLEEPDDDKNSRPEIYLKLAMAYFKGGYFENSYEYAGRVMAKDWKNKEAFLLVGRSVYKLGRYEAALTIFQKWLGANGSDIDVENEVRKLEERIKEMSTGKVDMHKHFLNRDCTTWRSLDCANYIGPMLERRPTGSMQRGIIANAEIPGGTALLVTKAMAFSWKRNIGSAQLDDAAGCCQHLIAQLSQLIIKNPEAYSAVIYGLGAKRNEKLPKVFCDPATKQEPIVDVLKLKRIVSDHMLGVRSEDSDVKMYDFGCLLKDGCGLFIMASYFNHSCLANTTVLDFGDVLFIRANQNIREGEEIFLPYISWKVPYRFRMNFFARNKFKCDCVICEMDRQNPSEMRIKREVFLDYCKAAKLKMASGKWEDIYDMITFTERQYGKLHNEANLIGNRKFLPFMVEMLSSMSLMLCHGYTWANNNSIGNVKKQIEKYEQHLTLRLFPPHNLLDTFQNIGKVSFGIDAFLDESVLEALAGLIRVSNYQNIKNYNLDHLTNILCELESLYSGADISLLRETFK